MQLAQNSGVNGACRYLFNGMEKDDEISGTGDHYDFGARMFRSDLGRWLSIDNLHNKFPDYSPYSFVKCSPIIYVDIMGQENTLYVVILNDENGEPLISKKEFKEIRKEVKKRYKEMGIKVDLEITEVVDPSLLDDSDSFVFVGYDGSDVKNFIDDLPEDVTNGLDYLDIGNTTTAEKSSNSSLPSYKGNVITLFVENINFDLEFANSIEAQQPKLDFSSGIPREVPGKTMIQLNQGSEPFTFISYTAFLIVHGSGHNAGLDHTNKGVDLSNYLEHEGLGTIMSEGPYLTNWANDSWEESRQFTEDQVSSFKNKFTAKKPKDNYSKRVKEQRKESK